jgi:transcriptional regulator with XRE-family HTH domain
MMMDMAKPFSEQLRQAITASGLSHYSICKACGINAGNFSKFMTGKIGLSLEKIDLVAALIGLRVTLDSKKVKHGKRSL